MNISDSFLQDLKMRVDISDIVSGYVNVKRRGRNVIGLCPFHNEKTPSFNVYPDSGSFYCFGCGVGGDVITFIRLIENLDYVEAVKLLAQKAGVEMPKDNFDDGLGKFKLRIYEANRSAARFYHNMLYSPMGEKALMYLRKRGLTDSTIRHFGLGYSPISRFELVDYLRKQGYNENEIIASNLGFKGRNGGIADRFFNRVIFPIIDLRGNVIAFGGRIMGEGKPKYLNTSDTLVFKKNLNLFALNFAKNHCNDRLILSEGYMDVIALHQAGFKNAIATLGTSLTIEQVKLISRYCNEVIIAYDSDDAGQKATKRAIELFKNSGVIVKVLSIPQGKDPDEFIHAFGDNGAARFKQLLEKSSNSTEYSLAQVKLQEDISTPDGKVNYLMKACNILASLNNVFESEIYASKLGEELGIEKSSIILQLNKLRKKNNKSIEKKQFKEIQTELSARLDKVNPDKCNNLRSAHAEEALIGYVMNNPDMAMDINSSLPSSKFSTAFNRMLYEEILKRISENNTVSLMDLSQKLSIDEMSRASKILTRYVPHDNLKKSVNEYIKVILDENDKISEKEVLNTDIEDIKRYIEKLKEIKK